MAITVSRHGDGESVEYPTLAQGREVLLFDVLEERGQESLGDRYRSLDPSLLAMDLVIFRSSSEGTIARLKNDPIVRALLEGSGALHLGRSYNPLAPEIALTPLWPAGTPVAPPTVDELRQAELETLLRRTNAVFEADNHHYILPSEWHADRFIRLGNACSSLPDNRRLADWLIGCVDANTDLLADTGTILSVLQEVQRHCQHRFNWATKIDALSKYPDVEHLAMGMEDLAARGDTQRRVLFVISVNSSGTAKSRFEPMRRADCGDDSVVVCETAPDAEIGPASLVVLPTERWRPGADGKCEGCGSPATVVVSATTYEPVAAYQVVPVPLSPAVAAEKRELFAILEDHDAVRLHYTSERGKHYGLWVDTPQLLRDPACAADFGQLIAEVGASCEVALIPEGPASEALKDIVVDAIGIDPHVIDSSGTLNEAAASRVQEASKVLVVDDAIVSGTTLVRTRRSIYHAGQVVGRSPEVSAVVFLARPHSESRMRSVQRPYFSAAGGNLHALHQALLPADSACAWCSEGRLLRRWYSQLSERGQQTAAERLVRLDQEITPPLLLGALSDDPVLSTPGAFFGKLGERTGFAAAACATQRRLDEQASTRSALEARIIDLDVGLDAYFDTCLLAGILRTVTKEQVRFASRDGALIERYQHLAGLNEALDRRVRCEIGWAALREVLPRDGVEQLLHGIAHPEAELMVELLTLRSNNAL